MATFVFALGLLIALFVFMFNSLTSRKNAVEQSYGAIHAYLKKRADLIPNLVAIVRGAADHEKDLLTKIVEARSALLTDPKLSFETQMQEPDRLSQLLSTLIIKSEAYPELKSNDGFLQLQISLVEIESQLAAARRAYSGAVTFYNNGLEMIPYNVVAGIMGLKPRAVYLLPEGDSSSPNLEPLRKAAKKGPM